MDSRLRGNDGRVNGNDGLSFIRLPREGGELRPDWIPACAGMTILGRE